MFNKNSSPRENYLLSMGMGVQGVLGNRMRALRRKTGRRAAAARDRFRGFAVEGRPHGPSPAVVLSNDTANAVLNRIQVVPISSQVDRLYPAEAAILLNGEPRKPMADQISTVSKRRLQRRLGALGKEDLDAVLRAVRLQLGL